MNLKIAVGSLQNLLEETSEALAPADKELKDTLPDEPILNADETSWRDRWLWIFVSSTYIYFKVAVSRRHEVLKSIVASEIWHVDFIIAMMIFLRLFFMEGVEPTNNSAERGIRPAVQWRKICFGNRSDTGAVVTSRLLTATRTCWLQRRNPLEFLVDTISAHRAGNTAPSLLN